MRTYQPPTMVCATCRQPVRMTLDGWTHSRRLSVKAWHQAIPVLP